MRPGCVQMFLAEAADRLYSETCPEIPFMELQK
jgi:hypothetical protein